MREFKNPFLRYGLLPSVNGWLGVFRMHCLRPAVTLIFVLSLTSEVAPAGLLAFHQSGGVVGPNKASDDAHGGAKALFTLA